MALLAAKRMASVLQAASDARGLKGSVPGAHITDLLGSGPRREGQRLQVTSFRALSDNDGAETSRSSLAWQLAAL
jgi:hypothetical protein